MTPFQELDSKIDALFQQNWGYSTFKKDHFSDKDEYFILHTIKQEVCEVIN